MRQLFLYWGHVNCVASVQWQFDALSQLGDRRARWWVLAFWQLCTLGWHDRGCLWDRLHSIDCLTNPECWDRRWLFSNKPSMGRQGQPPPAKTRYRRRKECRFTHSILHDRTWKISVWFFLLELASQHLVSCAVSWPAFLLYERGLTCQAKQNCWVIPAIDTREGFTISRPLLPWASGRVGALGKCYIPGKKVLHHGVCRNRRRVPHSVLMAQNSLSVTLLISCISWERASQTGNRTILAT